MKKIILAFAFLPTLMSFTSCGGAKNENNTENDTETTTELTAESAPSITQEQAQALVSAGLLTKADFEKPVFIDFNATWCGPCRQFAPYFEAAAEKYAQSAKFLSIDVDVYGEVANAFGIQSIPTVIVVPAKGASTTYVGTSEIIGDGVFEAIVEKAIK